MDNDYNRPRRPNADTLTYLKSLPFNENVAHEEIKAFVENQKKHKQNNNEGLDGNENDDSVDYPQNFSAALSALDEIKNEIASLAGDEFGSQCLETITRITVPYSTVAARKLLYGISGYLVHLSTHRYGSHVVQTIFQNVVKGKNNFDLSDKEICDVLEIDQSDEGGSDSELPSMKDILTSVSDELMPASKELAVHICGSHVLRSLMCILGGVEEEVPQHLLHKGALMENGGTRRGKLKDKKKKKKKKVDGEGISGSLNTASFSQYKIVSCPRFDVHDFDIRKCFFSLVWELTGLDFNSDAEKQPIEVGDLQQLCCHPSAGPLLIVLLRVLTIAFSTSGDKNSQVDSDNDKHITEFRLGIIPQQRYFESESHAESLAKHILCWDDSTLDANEQKQAGEIIYGLSGETRGSHMLETLLRISNDSFYDQICQSGRFFDKNAFAEYTDHDVSNFVIQTVMNTVRNRSQAESVIKCVEGIINNGLILDIQKKRRGLFWRACEMAAKFRIGQETLLKSMRKGFTALQSKAGHEGEEDSPSTLLPITQCIPLLICYQTPDQNGGRIGLDAAGTRSLYHLLRFVPRLTPEILDGIIGNHRSEDLVSICSDGFGSRCIIDGILEGPMDQEPFVNATKQLCDKLQGHFVTLSVDRVGHHSVRKIFKKLKSFDDKISITAALSKSMRTLDGNAMGRSIISDCAVREYLEGEDVWKSAVKKSIEKESFLHEIVEGELLDNNKKRKRKRKKKENDGTGAKEIKLSDEPE